MPETLPLKIPTREEGENDQDKDPVMRINTHLEALLVAGGVVAEAMQQAVDTNVDEKRATEAGQRLG
jgi:hypothetical protein